MNDQRGQGHQDKTGEPPLIERVAARMPVERVIDRMNCPSDDEANERDADAVRPHQREQHADTDLEGADVMQQMLVVGRKVDNASNERGWYAMSLRAGFGHCSGMVELRPEHGHEKAGPHPEHHADQSC